MTNLQDLKPTSECMAEKQASLAAGGAKDPHFLIEGTFTCTKCGSAHEYPQARCTCVGHIKIYGDICDALELSEKVICPGCYNEVKYIYRPCLAGNTLADALFNTQGAPDTSDV